MSNARYFADGVDFYRTIYDDESTEGPYITVKSAKQVGRMATRLYTRYDGSTYQWKKSYRIQKLDVIVTDYPDEIGFKLGWVDIDE